MNLNRKLYEGQISEIVEKIKEMNQKVEGLQKMASNNETFVSYLGDKPSPDSKKSKVSIRTKSNYYNQNQNNRNCAFYEEDKKLTQEEHLNKPKSSQNKNLI